MTKVTLSPLFSVIIPLYNKEMIIGHVIKSVLNQSFTNYELIVVNDGSTDNSANTVKSLKDDKIFLIEQENGGPSKARNTGVAYSHGDWILFLDADDELLPEALRTFSLLISEHPDADIIDCGQILKQNNTTTNMPHSLDGFSKNPLRDWLFHKIGPGSNHSIFKKEIVLSYPYNSVLRRFEDAELLIRMLQTAKVYSSVVQTSLVHCGFSSASKKREDISEDFAGHLSMKHKSFWAKMCVYRMYIENRELYPVEMRRLYSSWYYRYDLFFLYKLLNWLYR